jgi:DNA-binding IclR family transcriptional regulator
MLARPARIPPQEAAVVDGKQPQGRGGCGLNMQEYVEEAQGAQTLERGLSMLFLAESLGGQMTVEECRQALGLSRSTAYRILRVLRSHDLLVPTRDRKAYRLGPGAARLSGSVRRMEALRATCRVYLDRLARRTGETAILLGLEWPSAHCLDRVESVHMVRLAYEVGSYLPLHAGAGGHCLLAFQPPSRIEAYFSQAGLTALASQTPVRPDRLRQELAQVRAAGYAVTTSHVDDGASAVAAPVYAPDGTAMAAIVVAGPAFRLDRERAVRAVLETAASVTGCLGGRPPRHR